MLLYHKVHGLLMVDAGTLSSSVDEPARKQHEAPEYLERRRGRRRSAGFIHGMKLHYFIIYFSYLLLNTVWSASFRLQIAL